MYTHKVGIVLMLLSFFSSQTQRVQVTTYAGTIDGNQPVRLTLYPVDGLYVGKVKMFGDLGKTSTLVVGRNGIEGEGYELREFTQDGTITANWQLQLQEDSLKGKRYKSYAAQQNTVRLSKEKGKHTLLWLKKPVHMEGDYGYQFGENGPQGIFSIARIGHDRIAIDAFAVTAAPARNIAAYQDTVPLVHHRFEHKFIGQIYDNVPCEIDLEGVFYFQFKNGKQMFLFQGWTGGKTFYAFTDKQDRIELLYSGKMDWNENENCIEFRNKQAVYKLFEDKLTVQIDAREYVLQPLKIEGSLQRFLKIKIEEN